MKDALISHFWVDGQRFTFCGLSVAGRTVSPSPSCPDCQRIIAENDAMIAALESKTPREYRIDLAAIALAPMLRHYRCIVDQMDETPFVESLDRDYWLELAVAMLTMPHPPAHTQTLQEYADTWKATALRLVKGNR